MQMEELRGFVLKVLKDGDWNQITNIHIGVGNLRAKTQGRYDPHVDGRNYLDRGDATKINEIVWSLIIQGVLVPGINDSNETWPFLRLTDFGRRCVEAEQLLPHDPDGFLVQFSKEVPAADAVIREYLAESLQCFLHGLHRASAVMLGGASEKAVLMLLEAYTGAIASSPAQRKFREELDRATSIFRKYEVFEKRFAATRGKLPGDLRENLDSQLRGVFDLIRSSRNDAGHPSSGGFVDRDTVYVHLRLFVPYCKKIYGLIGWLAENPA